MDEFSWMVGILEGEGCFSLNSITKGKRHRYCRIQVGSCDLDVLERLQKIAGGRISGPYKKRKKIHSDLWHWYITTHDEAQQLMESILPHMSKRRQEQIRRTLEAARMERS